MRQWSEDALGGSLVKRLELDGRGRLVLACGGYRSGSTLQYNLVGEYVERINGAAGSVF